MPTSHLQECLAEFTRFALTLKGDEKSEAQTFLDHFFRALGHQGVIEAGATFEFRVAKKPGSAQLELIKGSAAKAKGGKKFADLLWPDRVLIEMKSRGENLEKHYDQTFNYWTHIVPKRPPFVILCNFDEFWIYDFNTQLFDPVDRVSLGQLADSISAFNFLLPVWRKPVFGNNRVEVTRKAADRMAHVFREIVARGEDRALAQQFILQLLVAMVAEDIDLLPDHIVTELLEECAERGGSSYDLIGGLFRQMASPEPARGGRYQGVRYFNGGLFAVIDPIELKRSEAYALHDAARHNDWSKVKPEIFGTLFQASMDKKERHAFGAQFTGEFDIQKVVGPTIVRPWRARIAAAGRNIGELRKVLADLRRFRVLDPACGSGNFLYIAYREIKRLEREILLRLRELGAKDPLESAISLHQFFGIDIIPFAVELAKVTLMLAKELEMIEAKKLAESDQLIIEEKPLPLDNLDKNIICADALFTEWPAADAIIGNPPYMGARRATVEYGPAYMKKVRAAFPGVPGRADFCVYWFRKAHDHLQPGARAGLVGTNTIRQNFSREGGLDYVVGNGGTITNAISTEVWSGDAVVHVSIVNWIKGEFPGDKILTAQRGDHVDSPWDTYVLPIINSALSPGLDVASAIPLEANAKSGACFQGQTHGHEGFLLDLETGNMLRKTEPAVVHPFLTGDDMLSRPDSTPERFVIDMNRCEDVFAARAHPQAFDMLRERVMPTAQANAEAEQASTGRDIGPRQSHFRRWWRFWRGRLEMMDAIGGLPRYVICVRHTKRPIFEFISPSIHPNDALQVFPLADDYSFGILQSPVHFEWFKARCSTLKGDFRYTSDTVFDTFPWPQSPTKGQIAEVAAAAVALRGLRREIMRKLKYSLRKLYRTLEEPGANPFRDVHAKLDTAVRAAYGMPNDADPLAFLLELNLACAEKEKAGEKITPPGLPLRREEHAAFISGDCIRVETPLT